jgi:DNA-nicking Smr family endonuclease
VAKLDELKALLEAARTRAAAQAPARAIATTRERAASPSRRAAPVNGHTPTAKHVEPARPRAASAKRHLGATKHADADIDIGEAFADVMRLPPRNRAPSTRTRPAPHARSRLRDEREVLELSKYGAEPAPHSWDIGQELEGEQTFVRPGLGSDVLVKLRRAHWVVQAVIDLHGMTQTEAHDALADFLLDARNRGLRCVRVIHGKGLTSPNREPVLKGRVRRWLAQWDDVLAYCEAPPHAGGSGAVVALLRGR